MTDTQTNLAIPAPKSVQATFVPRTYYQRAIADYLDKKGVEGCDPRWIEGYMRLQYSTLGHLDARTFNREIRLGVACVQEGGTDAAERNAQSFGL